MEEKFKEIVLREKERSLWMSRVPKETKDNFIEFANDYFCEDFGMAFQFLFSQALEYQKVKSILLNEELINKFLDFYKESNIKEGKIKLMNGKVLKGGLK